MKTKFGKVVGVTKWGEYVGLDYVFDHGDGFRGAVGTTFYLVPEDEYERSYDVEEVADYLAGAAELPEVYYSYEQWARSVIQSGENVGLFFDPSASNYHQEMESRGYDFEVTSCTGGGRIFSRDLARMEKVFRPDLVNLIRYMEGQGIVAGMGKL